MKTSLGVPALAMLLMWGTAAHATSDITISQIYGGGGNSGSNFTNDYIELFNRGTVAVDFTGWSVQYASATGTTWQVTNLSGTLQPGHYYLVQEAAGTGGTTLLPAPDATGSIAMSSTSGKVALVNTTSPLSGPPMNPELLAAIVDLVGYGTASFFEGDSAAPAASNTTAALRKSGGMTDTDDNAADFDTGSPNPRNSVTVGINGNPEVTVPARFVLLQIYPNPFNPSTTIGFRIAETAWVRLDVCDPLGRVAAILVNELKTPGAYLATFDASGLSTGAYFCRLIAGTSVHTRRMLLLR